MKRYVLGFCFNLALNKVVLIKKKRPDWQAGKLNGIGGHIEEGETPLQAMAREYKEESGSSEHTNWHIFGRLHGRGWEVWLFYSVSGYVGVWNDGPEGLASHHHLVSVLSGKSKSTPVLPSLLWLIPAALNSVRQADNVAFLDVEERAVQDNVCCSCGYKGKKETPCSVRADGTHCEHWWG